VCRDPRNFQGPVEIQASVMWCEGEQDRSKERDIFMVAKKAMIRSSCRPSSLGVFPFQHTHMRRRSSYATVRYGICTVRY
jgi:hypothetical protein